MPTRETASERTFTGLPINPGKVTAQVCLYSAGDRAQISNRTGVSDSDVSKELVRFDQARAACAAELDNIAANAAGTIGKAEAEIFTTQKHILNDPAILEAVTQSVARDRKSLEWAISDVFDEYEMKLASIGNEYLSERTGDINEVRQRLFDSLHDTRSGGFECEGQEHCQRGKNRVIVARELTADMMVRMDLNKVLGIVTEHGGISSHVAIIARSVGVPAVTGVHGIFNAVTCGSTILVDGDTGSVVVEPTSETVAGLMPADVGPTQDVLVTHSPPGTEVLANASMLKDVGNAAAVHADGIGLFRTEIEFMRRERLLSEDEQFEYYTEVVSRMNERPVTFRLLDVGGDKELPFLRIEKETNPYLGLRGARFLLENQDILATQVRAMARLSTKGQVRILFPMVIDTAQMEQLIAAARLAVESTGSDPERIRFGAMFEVPSACLIAKDLMAICDFASIGSNDLIQYLFAVDRNNEMVSRCYNPEHPILWQVLEELGRAANVAGKPLSICGEMAGRAGTPSRLVDIGITSLSVSPMLVPRVRNEISAHVKETENV